MERDCESELSKLNIEQNACIYHFGASVIHGQRSNILRYIQTEHLQQDGTVFGVLYIVLQVICPVLIPQLYKGFQSGSLPDMRQFLSADFW